MEGERQGRGRKERAAGMTSCTIPRAPGAAAASGGAGFRDYQERGYTWLSQLPESLINEEIG